MYCIKPQKQNGKPEQKYYAVGGDLYSAKLLPGSYQFQRIQNAICTRVNSNR